MATESEEDLPRIFAADLPVARETWSLRDFYDQTIGPWQERRRNSGKISNGNLQKERQVVRDFCEWDLSSEQAPAQWPWPQPWHGLPVSYIRSNYIERWLSHCLRTGLSVGSIPSRWSHLRTVLNWAVRLKLLDACPRLSLAPLIEKHRESIEDLDDADLVPTTYTADQLSAIYRGLTPHFDLQTAWVLGANCGPRTVDLFGLRWGINVRLADRELIYKAKKTGKRHWVPLASCVIDHLRQLITLQGHLDPSNPQGLVFSRLTSGSHADPEKSVAARMRNAIAKFAIQGAGLKTDGDFAKPWQVLRATCNSRLNNHRAGVGRLVTHGKDADVSSQHYWDHRDSLIEAIATLPQPAAFTEGNYESRRKDAIAEA